MTDIRFRRSHSLPRDLARTEAERIARDLRERFDLEYAWSGDTIHFRGSGVSGRLAIGKTDVVLEAQLGMLAAFFRTSIERHIDATLDEVFGRSPDASGGAGDASGARCD